MAERQFGPYRLVRQIAVGGMAEIHLAKTKGIAGFEKYVALKMIHPNFAEDDQFIQMLVDEAKIAVQLTHGNIAQTFDLGRVGETYYITMEYVDGADLYKILRRSSEQDLELPLDVCAFIGKEIASALDHAHRKRDNFGKSLGIVHRDVSPQNVLISYAGEVKLVDFGIAKATMKARQTAVGVIKGKYYYMSPEQAWGDVIDYRSDIFSAGIVLYEMITGQMLYLEEDLHKLLEMARKAEIAPPSKLRKGVPPQLERIVMHALQKGASERYQSAGDFATDLERFLHAYSPVFTAGKIAQLIRKVVGDPMQVPDPQDFPSIEIRDGASSTHPLTDSDLLKTRDELRDENSVIFRVDELQGAPQAGRAPPAGNPQPPPKQSAPRMTRPADPLPSLQHRTPPSGAPIPSVKAPAPRPSPRPRQQMNEETRQLGAAPPGPHDDTSGLLTPQGAKVDVAAWDGSDTHDEDLENIGERTMITGPSGGGGGFMMDVAGEDGVDATMITQGPPAPDTDVRDALPPAREDATVDESYDGDEEGPTLARDFVPSSPKVPRGKVQPPPALAAKIHAPAISAINKPRASRRTPPGGVPAQVNVLQQIVHNQVSEPMPVPVARPAEPTAHPGAPTPPPYQQPQQFPHATPGGQPSYGHDASGLPMGIPTPPSGTPVVPGSQPPHLQPYVHQQGVPPGYPPYAQGQPGYPPPGYPQGFPPNPQQVSPQSLYQFSPYGSPAPKPMTLTGQLRLFEADEMPSQYKLGAARRRWFMYIVAGIVAVSVAAGATFLIIRTTRATSPTTGSIHIESVPAGAEVVYDGNRLVDRTPLTITDIPIGTRHELRVELALHKPYVDNIDIPKRGGEVPVMALLKPVTGKIVVNSQPGGAEIHINDQLRGRTPTTLNDIDMKSATKIEIRLKDYQPHVQDLVWPPTGQIDLDIKLQR